MPFFVDKVHIKYEKRKNEAITLSIKDLKGLLEVAQCQPCTVFMPNSDSVPSPIRNPCKGKNGQVENQGNSL